MKICGLIAEYNPFHSGHAWHLAQTRRRLGGDTAIVCAMSGNFVQRGDLSILEKYERAEAAVQCGADLVLELPLSSCLCSAPGFAFGGVSLLNALGCVTHLSFGAEQADLSLLRRAAVLSRTDHSVPLRRSLADGLSYAAAMQQTVCEADPEAGALLSSPNNTLAVEYLAALQAQNCSIEPIAIAREGAAHDSTQPPSSYPSASYLRSLLTEGRVNDCRPWMPGPSFSVLKHAIQTGAAPVLCRTVDKAIVAHLRRLSAASLHTYCGGEDGLENRLAEAIRSNSSLHSICAAAQTRRYPLARIRRALLRAWLDLPVTLSVEASYLRVLAIGPHGRKLLRQIKQTCPLPLILKPTAERSLPDVLQPALARDMLADDLYALAFPASALHIGGGRFRKTPFVCETPNMI